MLRENTTQTIYTILPLTMVVYAINLWTVCFWGERQAQCLSIYFIAIQSWKFVIFFYVLYTHRRVLVLRTIFEFIWSLGFIVLRDIVLSCCFSFFFFVFMSFRHIAEDWFVCTEFIALILG